MATSTFERQFYIKSEKTAEFEWGCQDFVQKMSILLFSSINILKHNNFHF